MPNVLNAENTQATGEDSFVGDSFNFAYLDERTKRMIRRAILKAVLSGVLDSDE